MNNICSNTMDVTPNAHLPRRTLSLTAKLAICKEASVLVSNSGTGIRSTARRYNVQPSQIRRWLKLFGAVENTIHSSPDSDNNRKIKRNKSSQCTWMIGAGCKRSFPEAALASLKQWLDDKRSNDYAVSSQMLMA
jgi:transposase-like protein